jgi:hypothetical protein
MLWLLYGFNKLLMLSQFGIVLYGRKVFDSVKQKRWGLTLVKHVTSVLGVIQGVTKVLAVFSETVSETCSESV